MRVNAVNHVFSRECMRMNVKPIYTAIGCAILEVN